MSPSGALIVALAAFLVLGAVAAWLINIPIPVIGAYLVGGAILVRRLFRRLARGRARQDTETSV